MAKKPVLIICPVISPNFNSQAEFSWENASLHQKPNKSQQKQKIKSWFFHIGGPMLPNTEKHRLNHTKKNTEPREVWLEDGATKMCQKTHPETNRTKAPQNQPSSKMLSFKSSLGAQKADFFQGGFSC